MSQRWDISQRKKVINTYITYINLYIVSEFKNPNSEYNHLFTPQKLYGF